MSIESSSFRYTEFSAPISRKTRKNKNEKPKVPLITLIQNSRKDLQQDEWSTRCQRIILDALDQRSWKMPCRVICLGLGSPSNSSISRAQLGFLLDICDVLKIGEVVVYDPVFTEEDRAMFAGFEFQAPLSDENLDVTAENPVIFFMPHCDMELYETMLLKNWSEEQLANIVLISNQLEAYVENNPTQKLEKKAPALLRIVPFLSNNPLPPSKMWPAAFNSTSVQHISPTVSPAWFTEITPFRSESE
ncbi:hypothetical protein K435DRAFT_252120 [Dendrothele bispora CBS 962.96]|uniref:SRR1-like domain-containing protein n=1 Tax=Dendrothele bispora (strain CBS 962.96) TaxID=1314807 RepID=A0A4S8LPF9_DENBC|nr:hypothetical protein K435DRAFT_252120 [Dendrothele bispora CBS 962.96]